MTVAAVVGMQWGDEGKGKIVDALSERVAVVVRCQGGANAGHTVVLGESVFKLHVVPTGILREGVTAVIGNGVVVDPLGLVEEIEALESRGIQVQGRLLLSDRAHLVLATHKALDGLHETSRGAGKLGTTGRGIGPAYSDKSARAGLRAHDLTDRDRLLDRARAHLKLCNRHIQALGGAPLDTEAELARLAEVTARLAPLVADTVCFLHKAWRDGSDILLEGAQGTQLDIDFGTYPYVTSSNTTAGGLCTGSGLPPAAITEVHGVLKAFTTRVGEGPFVTELTGEAAQRLRGTGEQQWDEYGTTTGRPRRCGWCDLAVGRYAASLSGVTHLHVTKLDVLAGLKPLHLCTHYALDGKRLSGVPASLDALARVTPAYEELPGWTEPLAEIRRFADLPQPARRYVERVFEVLRIDRGTVSVGPRREQIIPVAR